MKKLLALISTLLLVLILGYLQPVFFISDSVKDNDAEDGGQDVFHTALPYEKIASSGYAAYIGNPIDDFTNNFGEPTDKQQTMMDYEIWMFGDSDSSYTEVNVKNNKISAIKAFNESDQTLPFQMNMKLSKISEMMTIYSDFAFTYNNLNYNIELTEEDMNYRPLIAFDNETFAILFFGTENKELLGIYYLDKETLLTVMPYQLIEGSAFQILSMGETAQNNFMDNKYLIHMINVLRMHNNLSTYGFSNDSQKEAKNLATLFIDKKEEILSNERMGLWYISNEASSATSPFLLNQNEFQKLVKLGKIEKKKASGIYLEPVYDPVFSVLYCFSTTNYSYILEQKEKENMSIVRMDTSMLILIQDSEIETLQTKESE